MKFIDYDTDLVVESKATLLPQAVHKCKNYLLVELESGNSFIDDFQNLDRQESYQIQGLLDSFIYTVSEWIFSISN